MPRCVMLEKGITYRPGGKLYPCCLWKWQEHQEDQTDYKEFLKLRKQKAKQMSSSDAWIPECRQCENDTKFKGESFRDHANESVKGGFWEMNFNNTCNFSCRMCNGTLSSTWLSIIKKEPNHDWHSDYVDIGYEDHLKFDKLEFYDELPNVRHIKLLGGEPFLMKEVYRMLDHVMETKHCEHIVLEVTTNLSQPFNEYWMKVIDNFQHVNITGSVDGLRDRYEYIRPGAVWNEIDGRAKYILDLSGKKENLRMRISACGMTLTAHQHNEMRKYWKGHVGIEHFDIEQVYEPTFMSYRSLHPSLREKHKINAGLEYDPKEWDMLVKQMAIQDKIHGTDFKTACPELFDVL